MPDQYRRPRQTNGIDEGGQIRDYRSKIVATVRLIALAVTALVQSHNAQRLLGQQRTDKVPNVR